MRRPTCGSATSTLIAARPTRQSGRGAKGPWGKGLEAFPGNQDYRFQSVGGEQRLADLFGPHSQLITYHFMFGPDWEEGCKICSMLGDHYDPLITHLKGRDVALVAVSNAPVDRLAAYKDRMGWRFDWVSSMGSDFNLDFGVTFTQKEMEEGTMHYNYTLGGFPSTECPGISTFSKSESGEIFYTYSAYSRALENFLGIYNFLDIVPKGRDEEALPYGMFWVRHHDRYDETAFVDPYAPKTT